MEKLQYKIKNGPRVESLVEYRLSDDTTVAMFQGFRGENPDLDFIVKYKEKDKSRVTIGLPYLPPFFTMSSRNFLIMMIILKFILIVIICVYAFYGKVKYTANVNQANNTQLPNEQSQNINYTTSLTN